MARVDHVPIPRLFVAVLLAAGLLPSCGIVPRSRMEESQKISQLLRAENARLKDQVLSLQSQNRDLVDRAVDDLRRLTAREKAITQLEQSVQAYQTERERLANAYEQLTANLGKPRPVSSRSEVARERRPESTPRKVSEPSNSVSDRPGRVPNVESDEPDH